MRCEGSGGEWREGEDGVVEGRGNGELDRDEKQHRESGSEQEEEIVEVVFLRFSSFSSVPCSFRATPSPSLVTSFILSSPPHLHLLDVLLLNALLPAQLTVFPPR
jgi:hypothetical protein